MFSSSSGKTLEVSVRMLDGAVLRGSIVTGTAATLEGVLSKETPFLEFTSKDGQRKFLAKHQIAYVEPVEPLRKPVLTAAKDPSYMDCFAMLGLRQGCSFDEAKLAFHGFAKLYHPDRYAGVELPEEVSRYMTDMFRQINTAFTEVRSELRAAA